MGYRQCKISQAEQAIKGEVSKFLNIPAGDLHDKTMPSCTSTSNDLDTLMKLIKEKYIVSVRDYYERILSSKFCKCMEKGFWIRRILGLVLTKKTKTRQSGLDEWIRRIR